MRYISVDMCSSKVFYNFSTLINALINIYVNEYITIDFKIIEIGMI